MVLKKQIPFIAMILSVVLTGCSGRPDEPPAAIDTSTGTATATSTTTAAEAPKSVLPEVAYPDPGPYRTVKSKDGAELMQGRFEPGKPGGTLVRITVGGEGPKTFNPWVGQDSFVVELGTLMYRGLLQTDNFSGEMLPDMAAEYREEPDHVTYILRLRKGLKWSDGRPITAKDVEFTWNTLVAGGYGNTSVRDVATIDGKMVKVTPVDDLTVKFVTAKPFVPFRRLLSYPIAPQHVIEPILKGKDGRAKFERFWDTNANPSTMVTSGPFRLSRYKSGERVEFTKAPNFYMVDKEGAKLPYLEKIIYSIVPDVNTALMKFKAKEIDVSTVRGKDVTELLKERDKGDFSLYNLGPHIGSSFIVFNMNQRNNPTSNKPYIDPVKQKWFNDTNFRQAVNHAISRKTIIANYFKGLGDPSFSCMSNTSPWMNRSLLPFDQDLELSAKLLKDSGFVKKGDALYDKDGHRVEFDMLYAAGGTYYPALAGMISDDLKKLGIKVNQQELSFNVINNKMETDKNWQCMLFALTDDPLDPHGGANVYKSGSRLHIFDQRDMDKSGTIVATDVRPWEKRIDEIFEAAAVEFDHTKRKALYDELQKIIYDEAPHIYLVANKSIVGSRNNVKNFVPTPLSQTVSGVHNPEEMWKDQPAAAGASK